MFEDLFFISKVVLPVFMLVVIGVILRQYKIVNEPFIDSTSQFIYKVSLPVLVFMKLHNVDIGQAFDPKMAIVVVGGTLLGFISAFIIAKIFKMKPQNEGVFVQGAFRSNYAIVALAIILRMYGPVALANASFLLLFALPLYNLLGIIALILPFSSTRKLNIRVTIKEIVTNPLLISVALAILYSLTGMGLHSTIATTANYIADTALPLALIGIGGGLNFQSIRNASKPAFASSFLKIIFLPLLIIIFAVQWGIKGEDLGILFIIFGCPTAIASYVLAAGLKGNTELAGNIIIISTLGSIFTIIGGLFFLSWMRLI